MILSTIGCLCFSHRTARTPPTYESGGKLVSLICTRNICPHVHIMLLRSLLSLNRCLHLVLSRLRVLLTILRLAPARHAAIRLVYTQSVFCISLNCCLQTSTFVQILPASRSTAYSNFFLPFITRTSRVSRLLISRKSPQNRTFLHSLLLWRRSLLNTLNVSPLSRHKPLTFCLAY